MLFFVPKFNADGTEKSREYFEHSTICGIDALPNGGCQIDLSNGRKVIATNVTQDDVAYAIANAITRPTTIIEPVSLEI